MSVIAVNGSSLLFRGQPLNTADSGVIFNKRQPVNAPANVDNISISPVKKTVLPPIYNNLLLCKGLNYKWFYYSVSQAGDSVIDINPVNRYSVFCGKLFYPVNNFFIKNFTSIYGNYAPVFVVYSLKEWSEGLDRAIKKLLESLLVPGSFRYSFFILKKKYSLTVKESDTQSLSVRSSARHGKVIAYAGSVVPLVLWLLVLPYCCTAACTGRNIDSAFYDMQQSFGAVYPFTKYKCLNSNILKGFSAINGTKKGRSCCTDIGITG